MQAKQASPALLTAVLLAAFAVASPLSAYAREGARSVGGGFKCYSVLVKQSNGDMKLDKVCYKSQ